jgi:hypothetical protein
MKSNGNNYPKLLNKSAGKTQVAYDIVEVTRTEMDGTTRTVFDWSYVAIEGELTRSKIINAIIADVHTPDAELSLINNELASPGTAAYAAYQALRQHAKDIAKEVIG